MSIKQGGNTIAGSVGEYPLNERNISNCITEIPQDIKLELNNGTLTLKAGSKVYVPNGAGVFDTVTIANDISYNITWGGNAKRLLFVKNNGTALEERELSFSGGTAPTSEQYSLWYDTTNNAIKYTSNSGSTWSSNCSFPIALIANTNNVTTSIDQIFNGFGYIGSTVFALPGVKGLIPDGRNADGSLKNIETEITNVQIRSGGAPDQKNIYADVHPEGTLGFNGEFKYDEKNNITYNGVDIAPQFVIAKFDNSGGKITNFTPKTVFHAVNYCDADFVVDFQRPTAANNYTWYRKYKSGWVEQGCHYVPQGTSWTFPIPMANDKYTLVASYLDSSSTNTPQWTYMGIQQYSTYITPKANGVSQRIYICGMSAN